MARRFRDSKLETRTARAKLEVRTKPYFQPIGPSLHIGYRKGKRGGKWVARLYVGEKDYRLEVIADADDMLDADGSRVLNLWQAQEAARKWQSKLTGDRPDVAADKRITVKDAIDAYLDWMENNRKSAQDARYRAEALVLPALGNKDAAKLTANEIRVWVRKLAQTPPRLRTKKGAKPRHRKPDESTDGIRRRKASANRTLTILKAALNRAWREGKVPSDAAWRRVEPFEAVDAARVRYLTVAESKRLVRACDPAFGRLVLAALQTGARYGELVALTVADFNADVGTVTIRDFKAGKARHVVLTDEGMEFFAEITAGQSSNELILRNGSDEAWGDCHQIRPMAEACKRAEIAPRISFHGLRHTWASLAVMNGVPLMVVARNLGHADTRMVEKHYGHLAPSYIADAIRAGAPRFSQSEDEAIVDG